jgi:hypothetical protein
MFLFSRPSSAFVWTSRCQNAVPLPPPRPPPVTASSFSQALCNPSIAECRPSLQSFISWEIIPKLLPLPPSPVPSCPPTPDPYSPSQQLLLAIASSDAPDTGPEPASRHKLSNSCLSFEEIAHSDTIATSEATEPIEFDTEAFPAHSHLFPSSPNGTWRNESAHALTHPTAVDYKALYAKLCLLAEEATDELVARLNRAFEGSDVPAMHDKVLKILPSVSMPDMRDLEKAVDFGCEWGVGVFEQRERTRGRRRWW